MHGIVVGTLMALSWSTVCRSSEAIGSDAALSLKGCLARGKDTILTQKRRYRRTLLSETQHVGLMQLVSSA